MILRLTIRNIVLIEELTIRFHRGMQVLSGETGAGKSIVVDAVNLVLGGRADRTLIRSGSGKASVEAAFSTGENPEVRKILEREGIEAPEGEVVLYREITESGKNLCRLCGVMVPLGLIREIGSRLMDIHGQHEHQFLMDPEMHMRFLDRTGDGAHMEKMEKTAEACAAFLEVHRRYARMKKDNERKARRMEELEAALGELHGAKLKAGEEETLTAEAQKLRNREKIAGALRSARGALSYGENESGCLEKIREAVNALKALAGIEKKVQLISPSVIEPIQTLKCQYLGNHNPRLHSEGAYYELEEAAFEISRKLDSLEQDPGRLERTEERLDLIRKLERKYGESVEGVLEKQAQLEREYTELCGLEDSLAETGRLHKRLLADYRTAARALGDSRRALAKVFEARMQEQLKDLGMEKTVFAAAFHEPEEGEKKPMPRPEGDDRMEFMISPNPGEPLKPLAKIASGGELSRIMLAMKALEAEGSGVDCMVFDEIDTGISGRMAQAVAEKMRAIGRSRQVICVSHLPQIAAAADEQYLVRKETRADGRTHTEVIHLDLEGRVREVARMVSGAEGSAAEAETYARKMIAAAGNKI